MDQKLASMAQLVGALFHKPKSCRFNSQSGHMPGLQVRSLVWARMRGNRLVLLSHINVFLLLSLPPFPSLKSLSMSSGEDKSK